MSSKQWWERSMYERYTAPGQLSSAAKQFFALVFCYYVNSYVIMPPIIDRIWTSITTLWLFGIFDAVDLMKSIGFGIIMMAFCCFVDEIQMYKVRQKQRKLHEKTD